MILASALLLLAQNSPEVRTHHDHVAVIVNDDIIRLREIVRELGREARRQPLTTERERAFLLNKVTSQFVENLLRRQAGQDLGLDPKLIQLQIDGHSERFIESVGSVYDASEVLKEADLDSAEARYLWENQLYNTIWKESVTGQGPSASGRVTTSRYIRPGEIFARYREYVEPLPWAPRPNPEEIGGVDEQAILLEINIDGRDSGPENALAKCRDAYAQALEGVSFEEIQTIFGGAEPKPRSFGLSELAPIFPDVMQWLRSAKPGEISPILPYSHDGRITGYHFVQLVERRNPIFPAFEDSRTQSLIRKQLLRERDTLKIQTALQELFERAYIWPPELAEPPKVDPAATRP